MFFFRESMLYLEEGALFPRELGFYLSERTLYFWKVPFSLGNLRVSPWKTHCSSRKFYFMGNLLGTNIYSSFFLKTTS